jgi:hypothetical protein
LADRLWHDAGGGLYRALYDRLRQADEPVVAPNLEALDPAVGKRSPPGRASDGRVLRPGI